MKRLLNINNFQIILFVFCIGFSTCTFAQDEFTEEDPGSESETERNQASYKLGNGLNFRLNDGDYRFGLTGFVQPSYFRETQKGLDDINQFSAKRTYFQLEGEALKEKVSFFIQLDFSLSNPLLDAWLAYEPVKDLKISVGQKQTFLNNREMTYREDRLQFVNRSFLSQNFSETGREFGLFVESKFEIAGIGIAPMAAITSGDGRNSFGQDSRDSDTGGIKYGGRLDLYPLGYFKPGNDLTSVDIEREDSLKMVIGLAGSQNNGASGAVGESHSDFLLYDENQRESLPDYRQVYADLLMKYKGFSFLAEYVNTSATGIDLIFTDETASQLLAPQEISSFLALGDSYNFQLGYITKNGYSFDIRHEIAEQEFENYSSSILNDYSATTIGVSKYFFKNALKIQASYSTLNPEFGETIDQIELLFHIAF